MATFPKIEVVIVGFGMAGGIIANELGKRTALKMVALERGPFRTTNPDFLMDHFDEWHYAVRGQLFQGPGAVYLLWFLRAIRLPRRGEGQPHHHGHSECIEQRTAGDS